MKKILTSVLAAACIATGCTKKIQQEADYRVVPLPLEIIPGDSTATFTLSESTVIAYPADNDTLRRNAELLSEYLGTLTGSQLQLTTDAPAANAIVLSTGLANSNPEAYRLTVNPENITIEGASAAGNFYGIQTLRKSIPSAAKQTVLFPAVTINDQPRFPYRGAHFDTSRHYFPVDSIKEFIDMLALHNINRFHWHITDDQGWRLEIKKYPLLTEIGSKREGTCVGHDFETSDSIPYEGYYTQEEAKEIVKYAADRHITVIPEIDLPGHMLGALAAYPNLGCTGGPYKVWQRWGVADDVLCAGNDSTLQFIDDVLTEVTEIFPSEYIHIGGDECPKVRWAECPKCQARIKALGLKKDSHSTAEQKLQSYVMEHAATTLAGLGRKMIGWDEIIEGGLFPGATVMSWRGEEGAAEAARQGHDAILTPTNFCYFDYSQSQDLDSEPLGIGGFVPVSKVYSLEPTGHLNEEQAKHILGAQANLWTEYIKTFSHAQYMELPRLAAMCEVQWTQPDKKDFTDFTKRLPRMIAQYDALGYNYATHIFDIQGGLESDSDNHVIVANFRTIDDAPIYYTLDGSEPTETSALYTEPVVLDKSCTIKAVALRPSGASRMFCDSVSFNKATSGAVTLETEPHSRYRSTGPSLLTDGRFGASSFNTGEWMGFEGVPMIATVDLGSEQEISSVTMRILLNTPNWIFDARGIKVEVSADGKTFKEVASEEYPVMTKETIDIATHVIKFAPVAARYVKVTALCEKSIPAWHGVGEGKPGFLFVDEIVVD